MTLQKTVRTHLRDAQNCCLFLSHSDHKFRAREPKTKVYKFSKATLPLGQPLTPYFFSS